MIHLDGVAVPQIDEEYLEFNPYDHQSKAQDLIYSEDEFFAINTSPTGSGKTYSWLKPALDQRIDTIAIFPTNALIADQHETTRELTENHYPEANVIELTGETAAEWRDEYRGRRNKGEAIRLKLDESLDKNPVTVVLSNPDIFTLMRKNMYRHTDVFNLPNRFGMLVFDEFHLADVRQRDLILFLVDEISDQPDNISRTNRFYFLSATPDESSAYRRLETRIRDDMGENVATIQANGTPLSETNEDYRGVMPKVDLELHDTQTFKTADGLLADDRLDEFVKFCEEEQTVVMLDGVHEVDEVYRELSENMEAEVHRITGFNSEDARQKIEKFDVLVSNAAVEVGLDFQPERLVFSATNASKLIQRLGRLRKLEGRDEPNKAWCYLPSAVRAEVESRLNEQDLVPRSEFESAVKTAFDEEIDLSSYSTRWSDIEAYDHVLEQMDNVPSDKEKKRVQKEGLYRIERHYYEPYDRTLEKDDLERLHSWTSKDLINELKTYRGSGFQVMVRDRVADEMKLYDVIHLLSWCEVEFYKSSEFRSLLDEDEKNFYDAYKDYSVGFCEFFGKITSSESEGYSGRTVSFKAENQGFYQMINTDDRRREPRMLSGLSVRVENNDAPRAKNLDYLRDEISGAERLVYAFPGRRSANKAFYGFGDFFFVYPFGGDSITFGTTALYMHCLVQDKLEAEGGGGG